MLTRTARLVEASVTLRRRIWASLPWGVRLAEFFQLGAGEHNEGFTRSIFAGFLLNDVTGMPDINGKPAADFDIHGADIGRLANRLPKGYGGDFGKRIYIKLFSQFRGPTFVEDTMMTYLVHFMESKAAKIRPGSTLSESKNFVFRSITNEAKNALRSKHRETSDVVFDDDGSKTIDFSVLDETYGASHLERALRNVSGRLRQVHPDAELYVKLLLEGHRANEIIGDPRLNIPSMLPHPYGKQGHPLTVQSWAIYQKRIMEIMRDQFQDLPTSVY